jgi:antitoxin CptB
MTTPGLTSTSVDPPGGYVPAARRSEVRIDERALSKLRWRCRRGLLENDLFIEQFFAEHATCVTHDMASGLLVLMDLSDNDLLDLLLSRTQPQGELLRDDVALVLRLMRKPTLSAFTPPTPIQPMSIHPTA